MGFDLSLEMDLLARDIYIYIYIYISKAKTSPTMKPPSKIGSKVDGEAGYIQKLSSSKTSSHQCFKCHGYGQLLQNVLIIELSPW